MTSFNDDRYGIMVGSGDRDGSIDPHLWMNVTPTQISTYNSPVHTHIYIYINWKVITNIMLFSSKIVSAAAQRMSVRYVSVCLWWWMATCVCMDRSIFFLRIHIDPSFTHRCDMFHIINILTICIFLPFPMVSSLRMSLVNNNNQH